MTLDAEESNEPLSISEASMSPLGKFLRTTNIDELPQFLNVLAGSMSIIGPRPHMIWHTRYYENRLPQYNSRHLVKPGITGLAQVKGFRGEIRHDSEMKARLKTDLIYIQQISAGLELYIFLESIRVLSITFWKTLFKYKRVDSGKSN